MNTRPISYYQAQFETWISPRDARLIVNLIDDAALRADIVVRREYPNSYENALWAKGSMRKQYVDEFLRGVMFEGDIFGQPRDYSGRLLGEESHKNNLTLLKSSTRIAAVWHSRPYRHLPNKAALMRFLAALPESRQTPLFPPYLCEEHLPTKLDAFFVVRYELDRGDPTSAKIGKIDVVVPQSDCRNIYCYPCLDLRAYAAPVIEGADILDIKAKDEALSSIENALPQPEEPTVEAPSDDNNDLDIWLRDEQNGE